MTRSRGVVLGSSVLVAAGGLAATAVFFLAPARASVGPLPAEALVLPPETGFVAGLDMKRFAASPFYQRYGRRGAAAHPEAFSELEDRTGINPERDLDLVLLAGDKGRPREDSAELLVVGNFDREKVGRAIAARPGVTTQSAQGTTVYVFDDARKTPKAAAFLDARSLVLGSPTRVQALVDAHARGDSKLRDNAELMQLLAKLRPGATFWMVGDQSLLAQLPQSLGGSRGDGASLTLPALQALTVTGDLDPDLSVQATGFTGDEAAAKNLADIVRGFAAIASMQAAQRPELRSLTTAFNVTSEAKEVHVNLQLPYSVLDALQPKAATPTSPPDPRAH